MSGFLTEMGRLSQLRADRLDSVDLARRVEGLPTPPQIDTSTFGVIAEIKFSAPSVGVLRSDSDPIQAAVDQARVYEDAGARAISVLTEPTRFAGDLDHLESVADAVGLPVMRKDFLVQPTQVLEARAFGAAGVLLIVRMLDDETLAAMVGQAEALGMFVLLEAFDEADLDRSARFPQALIGLNCRDLQTLQVQPSRFGSLSAAFPPGRIQVAESGLESVAAVESVYGMGYGMVLVGSALMKANDPSSLLREMASVGRNSV